MAPRKNFLLRMDPRLWADLEAWSQEEMRSVNGQIEYLLQQAVRQRRRRAEDPTAAVGPPPAAGEEAAPPDGG